MSGYSFIDASNPQGERLVPQGSTVSDVHSFAVSRLFYFVFMLNDFSTILVLRI